MKSFLAIGLLTVAAWAASVPQGLEPVKNLPVMGGANDVSVGSPRVAPNHSPATSLDDPLGVRYQAGVTYYDFQHNGSAGKMIGVDDVGYVHVVWMRGLTPTNNPRHIYYNVWDPGTSHFFIDGEVQVNSGTRGGYACLALIPQGIVGGWVFPAFHQAMSDDGGNPHAAAAFDYYPAVGAFTVTRPGYVQENGAALQLIWPKIAVGRDSVLHLVSTENLPVGGVPSRFYYSRGIPEWEDGYGLDIVWQNVDGNQQYRLLDSVMTIAPDVAASKISDRVVIAYPRSRTDMNDPNSRNQVDNDLCIVVSEDGGLNWGPRTNVTRFIYPDPTCASHDPVLCDLDTIRLYDDVSPIFDLNDNLHVAFTGVLFLANERSTGVMQSDIWHWSEETDQFSEMARAWWFDGNHQLGVWQRNVQRPSLSVDPVTGYLYCSYQLFDSTVFSTAAFLNADAFVTVSTNNGRRWAVGTNVTNTRPTHIPAPAGQNLSERDITLADRVTYDGGLGYLHLSYLLDLDAGSGIQQNPEGIITLNPFYYQRVPTNLIPTAPLMPEASLHVNPPGQGYVTLTHGGPPDWDYVLHYQSGELIRLVFTNFCEGTTGSVNGPAAQNGWRVLTNGDGNNGDSIVFVTDHPLSAGSLAGFRLSHPTCAAQVRWAVQDSSGIIDGPLPIELASFTALGEQNDIRINFRTASEIQNAYFEILRSTSETGSFTRIARLETQGNGATGHSYEYVDRDVSVGPTYWYFLVDVAINGQRTEHRNLMRSAALRSGPVIPDEYDLAAYPNPFNPATVLSIALPEASPVKVMVYDVTGRFVRQLTNRNYPAGVQHIAFDGATLPGGVYFVRLEATNYQVTRKVLLLK